MNNNRLFLFNNIIIKYSAQNIEAWEKLVNKNISFINTPIEYSKLTALEKKHYINCESKIKLPYLNNYYTLYNLPFIKQVTKKDILLLMKKMLLYLKIMHDKNVFHGDLYSKNIMLDNDLNISFIDFDASIIDNIVSEENTYCIDYLSLEEKKIKTAVEDKKSIFMMLCYYLVNNNFSADISYRIDIDRLILPKYLSSEIKSYINERTPNYNYYYMDIIDELLSYEYNNKINVKKN